MDDSKQKVDCFFSWLECECHRVIRSNMVGAYVSAGIMRLQLEVIGILPKDSSLVFGWEFQEKYQKRINRMMSKVAKEYDLIVGDHGFFCGGL